MGLGEIGVARRLNSWQYCGLRRAKYSPEAASAMTECNRQTLSFSSLGPRKVEADFSAGALTTDAGALLLREADRRLGLLDALDRAVPDPRHPELITHPQRALLAQRVFGIACGYEDLN